MAQLGKNEYKNDWNSIYMEAGVNAWIGKLANGSVATAQTLPWDYKPWGCGQGIYGSCNGLSDGRFWIQFEICSDGYQDRNYFNKVYKEACELTAYLCKKFNIDPNGYVHYNGRKIPTILCHADAHSLGFGSNHSDVYLWFNKFGKSMSDVRYDVATMMNTQASTTLYRVRKSWQNVASQIGAYANLDNAKNACSKAGTGYYVYDSSGNVVYPVTSYLVQVTTDALNIRSGASTNHQIVGCIRDKGVYTIVETKNGWGRLKSGQGWICLEYTKNI